MYHVTNLEKQPHKSIRTKLDGQSTWEFFQTIEWRDNLWLPQEMDYELLLEEAREVAWLEILVVTGQSERQALWEYNACFGVPDEDL